MSFIKETLPKYSTVLLQIIIILTLILLFRKNQELSGKVKEYWENPNFKTRVDTFFVDYTKLPKPDYKNYVPPAVTIVYVDSTKTSTKHIGLQLTDILRVVDSLNKKEAHINLEYLKRYPNNPKLAYMSLSMDSLKTDLLNIDGNITSNRYGINLARFKYQWINGNLQADRIKPTFKSKFSKSAYAYFGYDVVQSAPLVGSDVSLNFSKIRVKGQTFVTIDNQPRLYVQGSIGYKIW